jgi:beta-lactam-binding protein with PASTA domain
MLFLRFLFSKFFLKQLLLAFLVALGLIILSLRMLDKWTHNGQTQAVPDLQHLPLAIVDTLLLSQQLRYEVLDSAKYDPSLPPLAVIEQNPLAGEQVKINRKIYLTLNPSDYRKVSVPDIIQITKRNAASILKSVGLNVGEISYRNAIGKDMVLELRYEGRKIAPGTVLPKTTPIDLVLGNGRR